MPFFIKHVAGILLMPPTINFFLIVGGWLVLFFSRGVGKFFIIFGIVTLWLFCTPIVAQFLILPLQNKYPVLAISQLKPEKNVAIVVLEAGLNMATPEYGNRPAVSNNTLTRLRYAAFLYQKTHDPILVSGNNPYNPNVNQTDYMAKALQTYFHVPTKWREDKGYDTDHEGIFSVEILKKAGIKKIYLVTHAFHMPRSVFSFENKGIQIIPAPTDYQEFERRFKASRFIPSASALNLSVTALHEYLGLLWYQICSWR